MALELKERSIQTDDEGYMIDSTDWNDEVARQLAQTEQLDLTEEH